MATAGAVIASVTAAAEAIVEGAAKRQVAAALHAAAGQNAPAAAVRLAAVQRLPIQAVRVPAQVMRQLRVAADIPAVVADMPAAAVVADMPEAVVDIGNL